MSVAVTLAIGFIAGVISGLFGVGGGVVVVPALVLLLGFTQHRASGTSTMAIVASSAAALAVFAGDGDVDWGAGAIVLSGSVFGAAFAARYLDKVPAVGLTRTFSVVLVIAAVRLAVG